MLQELRPAVAMVVLMTALTGIAYPLGMTGVAKILLPEQAGGSLLTEGGRVIGSSLIGQQFTAPGYFHGRPSYAGEGYEADNSSGSNLGPTSRILVEAVGQRSAEAAATAEGRRVPIDLVTGSASGLDPHISPAAAYFQAAAVAKARGMEASEVRRLIGDHVERRTLGMLGEPRVNVLMLNMALDALQGSGLESEQKSGVPPAADG